MFSRREYIETVIGDNLEEEASLKGIGPPSRATQFAVGNFLKMAEQISPHVDFEAKTSEWGEVVVDVPTGTEATNRIRFLRNGNIRAEVRLENKHLYFEKTKHELESAYADVGMYSDRSLRRYRSIVQSLIRLHIA